MARLAARAAQHAGGTLWVAGSPIGNLGDVSARAAALLQEVPVVAAESVHTAEALLRSLPRRGAAARRWPRVVSYHAHNERERLPELLAALRGGEDVALLSRAGTPLLRDPGRALAAAAHGAGLAVRALPGPSSLTAALSVSGLRGDRLLLEGYLPLLPAARLRRLRRLRAAGALAAGGGGGAAPTLAFLGGAAGLAGALGDLAAVFGAAARACVAKDLTTPQERVLRGPLGELCGAWAALAPECRRGAVVLLVEPPDDAAPEEEAPGRPPPPPPPPASSSAPAAEHGRVAASDAGAGDVAKILLRGGVRPQQAALMVAQLTGAALSVAQRAVEDTALSRPTDANPADAFPEGADSSDGARQTLHLVNLGPHLTREELSAALAEAEVAGGDLSLTDNLHGERVAFARFATPEAASEARARINLAGLLLGASRPVMAGWARRDRWLG